MPQIATDQPRQGYTFKGKKVSVPIHFNVGDTLDENTARFANRQLASVTGNVLASALNRKAHDLASNGKPEGYKPTADELTAALNGISEADVQTMFDTIYANYEIGKVASRDGSSLHDPVQSVANNIAWERVKPLLKARNIKVSSVTAEKKAQLIGQMLERDPSIMETAKAQVGNTSVTLSDDIFAGLGADTANAPASGSTEVGSTPGTDTPTGGEGNDTVNDTNTGDAGNNTVTSGEGGDTVTSDTEGTTGIGGATTADNVVDGNDGSVPGADNPGSEEVAPDASKGEKTPKKGAFS